MKRVDIYFNKHYRELEFLKRNEKSDCYNALGYDKAQKIQGTVKTKYFLVIGKFRTIQHQNLIQCIAPYISKYWQFKHPKNGSFDFL